MRWTVTTRGEGVEQEQQHHDDPASAWEDYQARILALELDGYTLDGDEAVIYGRRWSRHYARDGERVSVRVEHTP